MFDNQVIRLVLVLSIFWCAYSCLSLSETKSKAIAGSVDNPAKHWSSGRQSKVYDTLINSIHENDKGSEIVATRKEKHDIRAKRVENGKLDSKYIWKEETINFKNSAQKLKTQILEMNNFSKKHSEERDILRFKNEKLKVGWREQNDSVIELLSEAIKLKDNLTQCLESAGIVWNINNPLDNWFNGMLSEIYDTLMNIDKIDKSSKSVVTRKGQHGTHTKRVKNGESDSENVLKKDAINFENLPEKLKIEDLKVYNDIKQQTEEYYNSENKILNVGVKDETDAITELKSEIIKLKKNLTECLMNVKPAVIIPGLKEQMMEDMKSGYWYKSIDLMKTHLNNNTLAYKQLRRVTSFNYPLEVAKVGYIELLQVMLDNGLPINTGHDVYNRTMLHEAAYYEHSDVVQLLIQRGADVNVRDDVGYTPLLGAAYDHNQHSLVWIPEEVDINGTETIVYVTLHDHSVQDSYPKTVQLLVESGADVNATNNYGDTPLLLAAKKGNLYVIQLLLESGANVNAADRYGRTPLHKAVEAGFYNLNVMQLLINCGANINATDLNGDTPLHYAAEEGDKSEVQFLVDNRCDTTTRNNDGHTARDIAWTEEIKNILDEKEH